MFVVVLLIQESVNVFVIKNFIALATPAVLVSKGLYEALFTAMVGKLAPKYVSLFAY